MGLLLFGGRLLLLLGLYGLAFKTARLVWQGLAQTSSAAAGSRPVQLTLRKMVGSITVDNAAWVEGTSLQLPLPITFGRQPGNTVLIEDPFVSACHAELSADGTTVWLIDRGSKNGTWVGQKRLDRPVKVEAGGEFRLGGTLIRLEG